jgi:hypothetical protein
LGDLAENPIFVETVLKRGYHFIAPVAVKDEQWKGGQVRAGLRRAKLEGRVLGRKPIEIDGMGLQRDRARGLSLAQLGKAYKISRTSVARALKLSPALYRRPHFLLPQRSIENMSQKREHRAS